MTTSPILSEWTDEGSFKPLSRYRKMADAQFVIGERYLIDVQMPRSSASERHQFAFIDDAWHQLPERLADQFPTQIHLRKACLIDAGFFNETIVDAGSTVAALRVAAVMRSDDEYARVVVRGPLVVRRVAKSQKRAEMGAKDFQQAKTAILEILSVLIGVAPDALEREAGRAA